MKTYHLKFTVNQCGVSVLYFNDHIKDYSLAELYKGELNAQKVARYAVKKLLSVGYSEVTPVTKDAAGFHAVVREY